MATWQPSGERGRPAIRNTPALAPISPITYRPMALRPHISVSLPFTSSVITCYRDAANSSSGVTSPCRINFHEHITRLRYLSTRIGIGAGESAAARQRPPAPGDDPTERRRRISGGILDTMQPSDGHPAPIAPDPTARSAAHSPRSRPSVRTAGRRVLLALLVAAAAYFGDVWYTRYRGTGWTQTFNLSLWYRRSRGEDLYHSREALLVHGSRNRAEVAITFDDGPHPRSRPQILDTLKRYGVHATFFDVGANMERSPDLVRRTLAEGHVEANHTEHHLYLTELSPGERRREINDPDIGFCAITGGHIKLLRPPGMRFNPAVLQDARRLGYVTVAYTTAAKDADATDSAPAEVIADRTLSRVENGSILLCTTTPGRRKPCRRSSRP